MLLSFIILPSIALIGSIDFFDLGMRVAEEKTNQIVSGQTEDKKEELKRELSSLKSASISSNKSIPSDGKCTLNVSPKEDLQSSLYIFVSFSMPEETLISLSKEAAKIGGILMLRGLPENSFQLLASKVHELRAKGMISTVQIEPRMFSKYGVKSVPCFVNLEDEKVSMLSGNVSVSYALEKFGTESAERMRKLL